ncbi:ligand-binding sensor domain-containing protein [Phaeodactylibacter xiamenensis]|uniref:ligand-binding sensor domain-containing protein n=1 Tax=Phaeodactylibacter xiamenensis TaxID=1524460 RepID=UPI003CCBCBCD
MNINPVKLILMVLVSSSLISCNGQGKPEPENAEIIPFEIGKKVTELDNQIWKVYQDTKGDFWFGSNGKGIYHYDGKKLKQFTTSDGLVHNQVRGIQEDTKGNIYIETPIGVSKFDGTKLTTLKVIKSPDSKWKNEPSDLWFNGIGDYLYRFDGEWLHDLSLPRQDSLLYSMDPNMPLEEMQYNPYTVYGIDKDRDGNVWFGTINAGAFRFDGKSFLWIGEKELSTLPDGRVPGVRSMIQDKDGYFWLSNFYSKYKINPDLSKGYEKVKAVALPKEIVKDKILYFNSGITDKEGNLWMTTYGGGVWKYDGESLSNLEIHNGIETILLVSIYQDSNGTLWLGTNNDGVYKQNGEAFEKFVPKV